MNSTPCVYIGIKLDSCCHNEYDRNNQSHHQVYTVSGTFAVLRIQGNNVFCRVYLFENNQGVLVVHTHLPCNS